MVKPPEIKTDNMEPRLYTITGRVDDDYGLRRRLQRNAQDSEAPPPIPGITPGGDYFPRNVARCGGCQQLQK
jgi:hypothetical protein